MNVLYLPRMPENTVGGWLECVFRPCYRYMKHTKPPSWPINLNFCPASWLRVTARLPSWPPYTPASFTAYDHIPGLWYGIYINTRVNLYN